MTSNYDLIKKYTEEPGLNSFYAPTKNPGVGLNAIKSSPSIEAPLSKVMPSVDQLKVKDELVRMNNKRQVKQASDYKPALEAYQSINQNTDFKRQMVNPKSRLQKYVPMQTQPTSNKVKKAQEGLDLGNAASSLGGGDPYGMIINAATGIVKNLSTGTQDIAAKINQDQSTATKYNKTENTLGTIGKGFDTLTHLIPGGQTIMDLFGTSGEEIMTKIGGKLSPQAPSSYMPSGNTTGNFAQYQKGGDVNNYVVSGVPYREGSNKHFAMDKQRLSHTIDLDEKYGFPYGTIAALGLSEAKIFDPKLKAVVNYDTAVSPSGAQGPYQFMPATARSLGLKDPYNFYDSASTAASYLADYERRFGSLDSALEAYNIGGTEYEKYKQGKRNLPKETRDYVKRMGETANRMLGYPLKPVTVKAKKKSSWKDVYDSHITKYRP